MTSSAMENTARRSRRKAAEIANAAIVGSSQKDSLQIEPETKKRRSAAKKKKSPPMPKEEQPLPKEEKEEKPLLEEEEISDLTNSDGAGEAPEEDEQEGKPNTFEKASSSVSPMNKRVTAKRTIDEEEDCIFPGEPIPDEEARRKWPHRYEKNLAKRGSITNNGQDDDELQAKCHYTQARVDGCIYDLYDNAYVKAEEGVADYICRIVEFFEGYDNQLYFCAQWFFRPEDTVIGDASYVKDGNPDHSHDKRRVFLSDEKNDNTLSCLVSKICIIRVAPNINLAVKRENIPKCDLYYDMSYSVAYSSFANIPGDLDSESSSSGRKSQLLLLDLYSGCGAMSTGLCLGGHLSGLSIQTRWAVDINSHACESLKFNHPGTEVRCEQAKDFLDVLREWEKLCSKFGCQNQNVPSEFDISDVEEELEKPRSSAGEFEVGKIVGICFGKTENLDKVGLKFKVRWKGYGPSDDTWEPIEGLGNCDERIGEFVRRGYTKNILPLPGTVDVICGGPPCQGISGFNRFRNFEDPLKDEKNQQMVVYMEIIEFLKPRFVLMENVVDILKFAKGFLGRYAFSRLVAMNYQSRLGIMAAGCYGLPQFRMRAFLWGACPTEKLPQFPLPTHDVIVRGGAPVKFEPCLVACEENQHKQLKKKLVLSDAISDLPPVSNDEKRDEMDYVEAPKTDFQKFIRLSEDELINMSTTGKKTSQQKKLLDHRPLLLNPDDYERVCQIPKKKGANFRHLAGVIVGSDNKAQLDPQVPRVMLPSKKPLVPDYAISFMDGKSVKPFGRLWWDETVPTVVTRAEPHNQIILHPEQDRVLSIRENARLQGFPDYYKFFGPLKQRYMQIGNAVAVPVSRALGYSLGQAYQQRSNEQPLFTLPPNYPEMN